MTERCTYTVGDRIVHADFGEGLVVEVRERVFYDILEIVFNGGVKRISSIHPLILPKGADAASESAPEESGARKPNVTKSVEKRLKVPRDRLVNLDYLTLEPESWSVVDALKDPSLDGIDSYRLHLKAAEHSLRKGFDQLVTLDHLHDVERYPYQIKSCLRVLREMKGRALLADEVGLGKTIEASIVLKEYIMRGLVHRALILVPASLTTQWREELLTKFHLNFVMHGRKEGWSDAPFTIASLDTAKMTRNRERIVKGRYDMVIVDEAHRLRNHQTLAWKFVSQLSCKYLLLLTATPVQNDLRELYNLVTLLRPGTLSTYRTFRRNFMVRGDKRIPRNTADLSSLLHKVMIRTTRSKTAIKFPRRRVQTVTFPLNPRERLLYDGVTEFVRERLSAARGADFQKWHFVALVLQKEIGSSCEAARRTLKRALADPRYRPDREDLGRLFEMTEGVGASAKLDGLGTILDRDDEKLIIFTQFKTTLDYLARHLTAAGHTVSVFHGNLTAMDKEAAIDAFRKTTRILISTEAGGEGRNLQFCRRIVNYDLPWNPMKVEQRIGRIHRLGQTRDIEVYNFSSEETVESYVLEILHKKINMFELVIGEMDMILGHFSEKNSFEDTVFKIWAVSKGQTEVRRKFNQLGDQLLLARKRYESIKEIDSTIFDGTG